MAGRRLMEPRIQYAKTEDGVNIAYFTIGEGTPLVIMPGTASHLQQELDDPQRRDWLERAAEGRMLVRYDQRGFGLSDRDVPTYSLDGLTADLRAVVDHLDLETFALFGQTVSGPVAVAYVARHPERVSHLILWCSFPRGADFWRPASVRAMRAMREIDWVTYTKRTDNSPETAGSDRAGEFLREAVVPDTFKAFVELAEKLDVADLLPQLTAPTLVLHRRQVDSPELSAARELASTIPNAQLTLLDGDSIQPRLGDGAAVVAAIGEFLREAEDAEPAAAPRVAGGFATILFTDMAASTTLADRLGDAAAQEVRRAHNEIVRGALAANGGNEIKHTGDGIMASFGTASAALDAAIAIQRGVAEHKEERPDSPLGVYVGLNAGEPIAEEGDLFGTSINLAARICDHAEAGQILAANVVRELAAGKDFLFADLGETELRGFEDPVKLWELRWAEGSPQETGQR